MMSARKCAFECICRVINEGAFNNIALAGLFEKYNLSEEDKRLCGIIVKGTIERKHTLDYFLSNVSDFPLKDLDKKVLNLLRMGVYQIIYLDRVPDFAVCNESAEIASQFGKKKKSFVNGVLRNCCRNKKQLPQSLKSAEKWVVYSVEKEIYNLISEQYGDKAEQIFESFFEKSIIAVRVNPLKTNALQLEKKLCSMGVECEIISERTIVIKNGIGKALSVVDEGEFYVQGLSSQRAVEILNAERGDIIVDVCACPGGKTLGAAMDMKNDGAVYSLDLHQNKLPLIEKNANVLGITIVKTEKHNSKNINEKLVAVADKVICDVPCSGIGSIGKRPEIRYKSIEDINGLVETQKSILRSSTAYLKKGGYLVYSVCSINKNEGEYLVDDFLNNNKEFTLEYQENVFPKGGCDGFYIAKILKN